MPKVDFGKVAGGLQPSTGGDKMKIHTDDCLGGETCDCPLSLDLDELERWVMGEGAPTPSRDILLELIALARKGQEPSMALRECQRFNVELIERAEAYERALRLARHALEKGRDDTRPLAIKVIDKALKAAK